MTREMTTTTGAGDPSPLQTHLWTSNIPDGDFVRFFLSRDWSNTTLGPLETWPVALRLYTLQALADSRPVVIYWCVCPLPPSPLFSLYDTHKLSPRSCCFRNVSSRLLFSLFFPRLGLSAFPPFRYPPACAPPRPPPTTYRLDFCDVSSPSGPTIAADKQPGAPVKLQSTTKPSYLWLGHNTRPFWAKAFRKLGPRSGTTLNLYLTAPRRRERQSMWLRYP